MSFLQDIKLPQSMIDMTGWAIIGVCSFNTFGNFVLLIVGSLKQMIASIKARNYSRRANSALDKKLIARQKVIESRPGQFNNFKSEDKIESAVSFCREWNIQRQWLRKNRVVFKDYEDEIKF